MKAEIHKLVHSKHHQSQGNAFGQLIHDGCTLDNGIKVQSVGLQMVSRNFDANHVICLCCQESKQNRGADVASLLQEVVLEMTGMNLITICGIAVQDRAALSVPAYLGFDEAESCDMHDGDKIGRSAIGELIRSRGKVPVNPFPSGMGLVSKFQNLAKTFSSNPGHRIKYQAILDSHPLIPKTGIQRDLNKTRISARHMLFHSTLRIKSGLKLYECEHEPSGFPSVDKWIHAREVEGVLNISKMIATFSQYETKCVGAYGPLVKKLVYDKLCSDSVRLVDHDTWGLSTKTPRIPISVQSFTVFGKNVLQRATLEMERRCMGNTHDLRTFVELGKSKGIIRLTDREKAVVFLDMRVMGEEALMGTQGWKVSWKQTQKYCVKFYVQCKSYQRKKKEQEDQKKKKQQEELLATQSLVPDVARAGTAPVESTEGATNRKRKILVMDFGSDSSNDEDDDDVALVSGISEQQQILLDTVAATNEFKIVSRAWMKYARQVPWKALYSDLPNEPDLVEDLMKIDLKNLMDKLEEVNASDSNQNCFGYLPLMASCSKCQLGALNSQSFAERINSVANLIVAVKRGDLDTALIINKLARFRE